MAINDLTADVRVGSTVAERSSWVSSTSIVAQRSSSVSATQSVVLSVFGYLSSVSQMVSFDAGVVILSQPSNVPPNGAGLLFIGSGFGHVIRSPSVRLHSSSSVSTRWVSDSAVQTKSASGHTATASVVITVGQSLVSLSGSVSYDGFSLVESAPINLPVSGSVSIQLTGSGLGTFSYSPVVSKSATSCERTRWNAESSMTVRTPSGFTERNNFVATISVRSNTLKSMQSYDASTARRLHAMNAPAIGGLRTSISGSGFAPFDI
eukprot:2370677-Rhodomonas_salina.1